MCSAVLLERRAVTVCLHIGFHSQTRVNKGFISPICCSSISRILEVDVVGYKQFQGNSYANIYYGLAF
jgi:hypothetical protein